MRPTFAVDDDMRTITVDKISVNDLDLRGVSTVALITPEVEIQRSLKHDNFIHHKATDVTFVGRSFIPELPDVTVIDVLHHGVQVITIYSHYRTQRVMFGNKSYGYSCEYDDGALDSIKSPSDIELDEYGAYGLDVVEGFDEGSRARYHCGINITCGDHPLIIVWPYGDDDVISIEFSGAHLVFRQTGVEISYIPVYVSFLGIMGEIEDLMANVEE